MTIVGLSKQALAVFVVSILAPLLLLAHPALATSPYLATDLIGQTDPSGNPLWNIDSSDNRRMPDSGGLGWVSDIELDRTHHKLYVTEETQNTIQVYNLNASNELPDRIPDYILGQPSWNNVGGGA